MPGFTTNHYSLALRMNKLLPWAEATAKRVRRLRGRARPIFCFTGLSGIGHGLALAAAYYRRYGVQFGLIYVRKEGEKSHHVSKFAHSLNNVARSRGILVFVDDFVDTGATRERVIRAARTHVKGKGKVKLEAEYFIECEDGKAKRRPISEAFG